MNDNGNRVIFQFTPLREGRPENGHEKGGRNHISIHAPPRGATPTRTATSGRPEYFNSRPSARGDRMILTGTPIQNISIHAPPRGATATNDGAVHAAYFNSRPSARGDPAEREGTHMDKFQFTPLREGRREFYMCELKRDRFQFTPLREGRKNGCNFPPLSCISIHAPPRGATRPKGAAARNCPISIHAPPRGATQKICNFCKSFVQPLQISMA